jgi:uncharacterized protein (DUF2147 family)
MTTSWRNLTRVGFSLAALFAARGTPVNAQDPPRPDAVVGIWETAREDDGQWSRVEIYPCRDQKYCGKIVWLSEPHVPKDDGSEWAGGAKLDINNPDESLRDRPIVGLELMHSFRFDDGQWKDGRIYDPKSGKTYRAEMKLAEDGETLALRGFIKIAFAKIGRTTNWTRFTDLDGPH